jgi:hypothetical protein
MFQSASTLILSPFHTDHQTAHKEQYRAVGAILRDTASSSLGRTDFRLLGLVYSGSVKVSFRSNVPVASGLMLLFVVSVIMVPLLIACTILVSESPMPHDQFVKMSRATNALGWLCLLFQVGAGCLVYRGLSIQKALVRRLLCLAGVLFSAVVFSFVCGFLASGVAEHKWYDMAYKLFS